MDSKLFLLEFHVGTIKFASTFDRPLPAKEEVLINIKFAEESINIDPDELPLEKADAEDDKIVYNMGKSYLFTNTAKELVKTLKEGNLEMSLRINQKTVGSVIIPWTGDFSEMVKLFDKIGVVKAVDHNNVVELKNKSDVVIGSMDVFTKLSCFGGSIETQFKSTLVGTQKEYVFKNPYDRNTFKCELLEGTRVFPVMNLLNPVTRTDNMTKDDAFSSWTELFGRTDAPSRASYSPFVGGEAVPGMIPLTEIMQRSSIETVSMVFRPEENKFFDFLNLMNTEVSTTPEATKLTFTKDKERLGKNEQKDKEEEIVREDPLELTADKINRKLCKNKDCPAAKKFKEYGIGPLATGKGLGTLYGDVEPPCDYGLSHTYGTMSNYGPFGVYTRPKRPNQPFIPPKNALETKLPPEQKTCCQCCNASSRLRGGAPWPDQPFVLIENSLEVDNNRDVLRLRGGGPDPDQQLVNNSQKVTRKQRKNLPSKIKWRELFRLRGGGPLDTENSVQGLKSPIKECKGVMDKFDEILTAYKKALGPCGRATCPNAPSLAQEKCKKICGKEGSIPPDKDDGVLCETPCDFTGGFPAAACREAKCAYAKYKLNLVDDDAALELQFLPPAVSGKCGHPKCPYPIQPDLPPIHWDCPDPLPKGVCRNLNCPHQPPDLRKLKCPESKPGPCGSPNCPYALPAPCELPTCPFRSKPCPYLEKQKKQTGSGNQQEEADDYLCENPECPFANEKVGSSQSFDQPNIAGHFISCSNPRCPFTTKSKGRLRPKSETMKICSKPTCPFANVRKMNVCSIPSCPYAPKQTKSNLCYYPRCPFAEKQSNQPKKADVRDNPRDPFDEEKCPKTSADCNTSKKNCDKPECPHAKEEKKPPICVDPKCPYAQPLPSCGLPGCPYEPVPPMLCPGLKKQSAAEKPTSTSNQLDVVVDMKTTVDGLQTAVTEVHIEKVAESNVTNENSSGEDKKGKKKKRKKRSKFVYSMGNQYPGVKVGHKECVTPMFKVPPKMGWLWNIPMEMMNMKPRRGWKPGAIQRNIAAMIKAHRQAKGLGTLKLPKFNKNNENGVDDPDDEVNVAPKPTLQIQKKDGAYWITMNPLKDPKTLVDNENPYMECTPMQFKITKNKKKENTDKESKLCYCEEEEVTSSSDSELDIEFTPPAGIIHPERFKKKKNIVHCEAQYDPKDFTPESDDPKDKKGKGKEKGKEAGEKKGGKKGKKK